jgi:hypothetical protein
VVDPPADTTLAVPFPGDLCLKAPATEATFANGPSLRDLPFTIEKPDAFHPCRPSLTITVTPKPPPAAVDLCSFSLPHRHLVAL